MLISCGCLLLFIYEYVNMLVMGFVLGQSLMVIPTECYPFVKKYLPIIMYCDVCCCLHVK